MSVRAKVGKWGGSLAIRIPKPIAEPWGVREGSVIELLPRRGEEGVEVVLRKKRHDLAELVAGMDESNRHGEADWGRREGAEEW